jgi:N-hydroxyarylamine O-acetyltransferase
MNHTLLNNYLDILGLHKNITTLAQITQLIQAHEKNFAFSSVKVLLKEEISLSLEDIYRDIVVNKRGGYCFEHNKLMYEVLKELGFDVQFYLARVVNNLDKEVPQTHRFTLLNFEGERYLIDVGIGFRSPNVPIKFAQESTYSHLGISYRIETLANNTYGLDILQNDTTFRVSTFDLNPCYEADFEMGHFYSHKHPCAVFVNNLVVSRITHNEIRSLRNSDYFKIDEKGQRKIHIKDIEHFKSVLTDELNSVFDNEAMSEIYNKYVVT